MSKNILTYMNIYEYTYLEGHYRVCKIFDQSKRLCISLKNLSVLPDKVSLLVHL